MSIRPCQTPGVDDKRGLLLIVAAAALWGTTGTAQALGPVTSDPVAVGLVRLMIAGAALLMIAWFSRTLPRFRKESWPAIALAGIGMAGYQPAFFTAVRETGVAVGTVVAIGSAPILAGLLGWLVEGERPPLRWWLATAIGILGVILLVAGGDQVGVEPSGVLFSLLAALAFAIYITASQRVVGLFHPVGGTALVFVVAAVFSTPLLFVSDLAWLRTGGGALMALHLGLIATALAYVLFSLGLVATPTASAATASLTEPMTAALLGVLVLGETPGTSGWAGISLILGGVVVLTAGRRPAQ